MLAGLRAKRDVGAFRWNDSGDFYSEDYLRKCLEIARETPHIEHYAYTKCVGLVKGLQSREPELFPANFTFIFSEGGRQDGLIEEGDRVCRVFGSVRQLQEAGFVDASRDDSVAWRSKNPKIGIVYHGSSNRVFVTGNKQGRGVSHVR
jgi:hypothetical protein